MYFLMDGSSVLDTVQQYEHFFFYPDELEKDPCSPVIHIMISSLITSFVLKGESINHFLIHVVTVGA